jgi:uroporphyrinogen decarboxylase
MMLHSFMVGAEESSITMEEYRNSSVNIARSHIDFARKYGLDGVLIDVDTCMEAGAIGVPVDLPVHEPARITTGLSEDIDICIEAMEKDKLRSYDRIKIKLEAVNRIKNEVGNDLLVRGNADQGPFSLAMLAIGITPFMMNLYDNPEKIILLIDRAYDVHVEFHKLMKEAGADMTSFGDSSCGPDLVSPEMYRQFSLPLHRKLAETLHKDNIATICHICGNIDLILEDLVTAGFPAIEADYKTDISRAAKIMKNRSVLFGPIDPSGVFYFGTPEIVAEETRKVLDLFTSGGLVIGAGCALPAKTPEANLLAFTKTVKEYSAC